MKANKQEDRRGRKNKTLIFVIPWGIKDEAVQPFPDPYILTSVSHTSNSLSLSLCVCVSQDQTWCLVVAVERQPGYQVLGSKSGSRLERGQMAAKRYLLHTQAPPFILISFQSRAAISVRRASRRCPSPHCDMPADLTFPSLWICCEI